VKVRNTGASVRARLLNKARADGVGFQYLLTRYGLERLLYRLSISPQRQNFLLKGALLFDLWYDKGFRPTRDIDLLGFGTVDIPDLVTVFAGIGAIEVDDGITFDVTSIRSELIRQQANYAGVRLAMTGLVDGAQCPVKIDVGYGDAVNSAPELASYPVMFGDMPAPTLRVYPRYAVIAEKLEAIISLGMANSRMKDYFDLWVILRDATLDQEILLQAVTATCNRRGTKLPTRVPTGLSDQFSDDGPKNAQWDAFVHRNKLQAASLTQTVQDVRAVLQFLWS